ncbi:NAD(P)H-dependent oxidoreductase [Paucibacter sp. M5-1]|uniref:NAD(P)H-dependent oxidoreductase n=1 Tax=Paucibacter sp. M5-1 TaxID=3015998 RepID=UPI0022B93A60|nr:NAD(P)H-dependent oxidoreductase [Paucibacter sp. M5-1]MCZ7880627.1 NAD(P)H-dependent oxidoreductase [Paucibacter sp. M5-1]
MNILILNNGVPGGGSVSRALVGEAVQRLLRASPGSTFIRRDFGSEHISHLAAANVAGILPYPDTVTEHAAPHISDELISKLRAADTVVIGAPICNFGISTRLRSWFDHVLRAGVSSIGLVDTILAVISRSLKMRCPDIY